MVLQSIAWGFTWYCRVLPGVLPGIAEYCLGFYLVLHSIAWGFTWHCRVLPGVLPGIAEYCLGFYLALQSIAWEGETQFFLACFMCQLTHTDCLPNTYLYIAPWAAGVRDTCCGGSEWEADPAATGGGSSPRARDGGDTATRRGAGQNSQSGRRWVLVVYGVLCPCHEMTIALSVAPVLPCICPSVWKFSWMPLLLNNWWESVKTTTMKGLMLSCVWRLDLLLLVLFKSYGPCVKVSGGGICHYVTSSNICVRLLAVPHSQAKISNIMIYLKAYELHCKYVMVFVIGLYGIYFGHEQGPIPNLKYMNIYSSQSKA